LVKNLGWEGGGPRKNVRGNGRDTTNGVKIGA